MDENGFRHIAKDYVRQYGEELHRELDALERDGAMRITPALDRRVHREIAALRHKRYTKYIGLIAACFIFVILAPMMWQYSRQDMAATESAYSNSGDEAPSPPAQSEPESAVSYPAPAPAYEILPLSFALPDRFTVEDMDQDIEKTIYYLKDSELDDVVMTLERPESAPEFDGMTSLSIGGHDAFGSSGNGYSLLTFETGDILYVLTCKYDINTLVRIGENILL